MAKVSTNVTIDSDIKRQAQALFAEFGMDLSTAINIFLRQSLRQRSIPFEITTNVPNEDTLAAIRESEQIALHPEKYKSYNSAAEMFKDILSEDEDDA